MITIESESEGAEKEKKALVSIIQTLFIYCIQPEILYAYIFLDTVEVLIDIR